MDKYERLTDERLIEMFREGDPAIIDFIMEKYKPLVRKRARALFLLGGENEDLIQEGMIGLFKAVQDFEVDKGASFHSFAETCISRQMYTAIEASKRKKHLPLNSYVSLYDQMENEEAGNGQTALVDLIEAEEGSNPEAVFFGNEFAEGFEEALKVMLSPLEENVLYLHLMGTDYKTIARLMGRSDKTVDNALQRIKAKAEKLLEEEKKKN
ncbi:MAG: RNA polymerase sporulation sigma factor SigH [Hespellia sp.]|nr:RNA polymerase sporulation sigma factor SigH [Hespellia sp.]